MAARLRRRLSAATRPEPVAPLAQATAASTVDTDLVVRLRHGLAATLGAERDRVVLRLPDRRISLPAATQPALEAILAGEPVAVGELPGLDADDQCTLARRLLREAVLVPEPG